MAPFDYCQITCAKGYRIKLMHAMVGRSDNHTCPYPQYPYGKNENPYWKNKWVYNKFKDYKPGCANVGVDNFKVSSNEDIEVWGAKNWRLNDYLGRYKQTGQKHNNRPVFKSPKGKFLFNTKWGTKNDYWVVGDSLTDIANHPAYIRSDKMRPEFDHDASWREQNKDYVGDWRESSTFHAGSLGKKWGELLFKACKSGERIGNKRCSVTDIHRGASICPKGEYTDCADIGDVCPNTQKVFEAEWWCIPSPLNWMKGGMFS